MSLTASMWTGVSGLLAHGEKMNVIGNNIANVNTVGFKGQRMDFADFVYQSTFTTSGIGQMGRGVTPGIIMNDFNQGPYESTTSPTDLAISGRGFFQVNKVGSKESYYTRAGNFAFNKSGYLVDPNGYALQGWKIDNRGGVQQASGGIAPSTNNKQSSVLGTGSPQDILLDSWTVDPQQTTNVQFQFQLNSKAEDNAHNDTNPFAGLFGLWDGTYPPATPNAKPIPSTGYAYQETLEVYDEAGVSHKLTIYLDKVDPKSYDGGSGEYWEYIVTMDPSEDMREFAYTDPVTGVTSTKKMNETKSGGLLMSGTMQFNSGGQLVNQSAYTWGGSHSVTDFPGDYTKITDPSDPTGMKQLDVLNLDPSDMNNWYPAAISNTGLPIFVPNFSGILDAQSPGTPAGARYNTEFALGARASNFSMPWQNQASLGSLSTLPYSRNPNYNPDGSMGPEFFLVNPAYDPSLNKDTSAKANNYLFNNVQKLPRMTTAGMEGQLTDPRVAGTPTAANRINISKDGGATYQAVTSMADLQAAITAFNADPTGPIRLSLAGAAADLTAADLTDIQNEYIALNNRTTTATAWADYNTLTDEEKALYWFDADSKVVHFPVDPTTKQKIIPGTAYAAGTPVNANNLAGFTKPVSLDATSTKQMGDKSSSTLGKSQDGYTFGNLTNYYVDKEGILSGVYSNGVTMPLWQIVLYDFTATQGLRREGGNLYSATRESGDPKSGPSGIAGLGTIQGQTLEQSNVDMSREFVQMITTQRGFQSNSKIITTTDTMLDTVINMKR